MFTEGSRQYALDVEAHPSRVPQVRRIVAAHLRHWRLETLIQPVALGVCELLTNVYRHAGPDKSSRVELRWSGRWLTVSVADNDPHLPQVCRHVPSTAHGRGLAMVAAMSDSWGTHATPGGGKAVWFTLRALTSEALRLQPFTPPSVVPAACELALPVG